MRFRHLKIDEIPGKEISLYIDEKLGEDKEHGWVPSYRYDIVLNATDEVIGSIDVRIGHNENTYFAGNIGYRIEAPWRGHHYAGKACRLIRQVAEAHGMTFLVITCNPDNEPSRRTCEWLGLFLESIVDLPPHNELYQLGERQKCRFIWDLAA